MSESLFLAILSMDAYNRDYNIGLNVTNNSQVGIANIGLSKAILRHNLGSSWAVESFRLCSTGVADTTQIHTQMCYSEFNDIIDAMDADVISMETSRSKMELLGAFKNYKYPNEIGPGLYDIHSPRVPAVEEMTGLLKLARQPLSNGQLWINPDCDLKAVRRSRTRRRSRRRLRP